MTETDKLTEDRIFDAATDVFIEKGFDGSRMQDIANHAGINKSLLHYYYRTKDRLFAAVFEKTAAIMFAKFSFVFDENLTLEEKIKFFYREHINFLQKNPHLPAFVLNEINRNPARLRKLLSTVDVEKFWRIIYEQHGKELDKYNITRENIPQIMSTIAAISVFPFAARGLFEGIFERFDVDFDNYLEERKVFAADFVIKALTK